MRASMLYLLLACAQAPEILGTWMFTRTITPTTGEECATGEPDHNLDGAYAPGEDTGVEDPWTSASTEEDSPEVFFGRLEEDVNGLLLIIGNAVYPGTAPEEEDGSWNFAWTRSSHSYAESEHASGYLFTSEAETSETVSITGTFTEGTFQGLHSTETGAAYAWSESDTWSDEVAAVVGTTGALPVSGFLVRADGAGVETPAVNDYATFDCADSDCYLEVQSACAYSYDLTGIWTAFTPDDNRWVEDAGQPAGSP